MKKHRIEKYWAMLKTMPSAELKKIQAELGLSNSDMAHILHCSRKTIEGYRSDSPTWGTPIPASVSGFIRMMVVDCKFRDWKSGKNLENYHKKEKPLPRRPVGRPRKKEKKS